MEKLSSKCENCGSELWYNPKEGCLTCKYCESNYFLPTRKENSVLVRQYDSGFHPNVLSKEMNAYQCDTCKNVYYMSSTEKSKKCPNCGNSSSSLLKDSGLCADGLIPFEISKKEAADELVKFFRRKSLIPTELKRLAENQKLMGVFIPVWNFSFNIYYDYSANVIELKKDSTGYFYSTTKPVFGDDVKRIASLDEAATKNEDEIFLKLFNEEDYNKIIPYRPEYTFGYRVDDINKSIHDYYNRITKEAELEQERKVRTDIYSKYKEVRDVNVDAQAADVFFNFAYVPCYVNTYTYKGKVYRTYISGTTGKVAGKTPVSAKKVFGKILKFLGFAAIIAGLALIIF